MLLLDKGAKGFKVAVKNKHFGEGSMLCVVLTQSSNSFKPLKIQILNVPGICNKRHFFFQNNVIFICLGFSVMWKVTNPAGFWWNLQGSNLEAKLALGTQNVPCLSVQERNMESARLWCDESLFREEMWFKYGKYPGLTLIIA